jgi:hypothetical protein
MDPGQKIRDLAVSDTGFVFDPYTGATFTVNATGLFILRGLQREEARGEILAGLQASFGIGQADLDRDLDEFVGLLRNQGLLPTDYSLER